ncbi:MAG: NAD(P)(+) transhydrogenase (Re/Si-specific) subunit alpha, partial [Pirellulaceae bacterium]|nr:NAD(P)(+) transhydrogenase (Re/Si-specific) subunit alpha [Pirellulaceae bacterium]
MILGVAKEILDREKRVAAIPETVAEFVKLGFEVIVETGAGLGALKSDAEYEQAGAKIVGGPEEIFSKADVVLKVKQLCFNEKLGKHEADLIGDGKMLVTFLHPAS